MYTFVKRRLVSENILINIINQLQAKNIVCVQVYEKNI